MLSCLYRTASPTLSMDPLDNTDHYLMIMESFGRDQPSWVRFLAQHSALVYYIAL